STQVATSADLPQVLPEPNPWPPQPPPDGSLPIPSPRPKNSSILSQGSDVSPNGDSSRLDPELCLTQGFSMVNEKSIFSLACSNLDRHGGESTGDNPSHSITDRRLESGRSLRDSEPRVNRRRARRSRIIGPYHTPNYQQLSLHASFEGDDIPREDAKNSSIFKSAVVTDDSNGEGLRDAGSTISLPASEIPNLDISLPPAGDEPIVSPTGLGTTTL
ncbi:hypothetical protein SLA2020_483120, partial [Shorea laevis]